MTQVTQEQKDTVTKTFAIVGFIAAILFAVWLAVQIVGVMPSAFSSLASIADGVYNYTADQQMTVASKKSVVNSGEAFNVAWTNMPRSGSYTFAYACTQGISTQIRDAQGDIVALACNTPVNLGTKTELDIIATSEKQRFTDLEYTIMYIPSNDSFPELTSLGKTTIVNASIPTYITTDVENTEDKIASPVKPESKTDAKSNENKTSENKTSTTGLTAGKPTTIEEVIYAIPASNPNGDIDLEVKYLAVGTLTDKIFKQTGTIPVDAQGAFQFAVENIGTKTSGEWTFTADLPSGITYTSKTQKSLKPSEKAIITIGFEGLTQLGVERFGATLDIADDIDASNNKFNWAVEVVK